MMADYKVPGHHVYDGMVFPSGFPAHSLDRIKQLEFHEDDILITSYPKSGSTWMREVTDLIRNDLDFTEVQAKAVDERVPFLDVHIPDSTNRYPIDIFKSMKAPRIAKSHLPYHFFERSFEKTKPRCIIVMRNLKDVLVSYYHLYQVLSAFGNFPGTFDDFFELFRAKRIVHGDWADYNLSWWKHKDDPKFHFIKYEDMKKDSYKEIQHLAEFMGKSLTDEQIKAIVEHTSFDKMKSNPMTNKYNNARKGIVGDWKNHFNEEQIKYIDNFLDEKLKGSGLSLEC